jgi:hypothetical protein
MKYFVLVIIIISLGSAANIVRAPEIQVKDNVETQALNTIHQPLPISINHPIPRLIDTIPDLSSTAGTEGKNIILAEDGQNVAVIYCRSSGSPDNMMVLAMAYSTDLGNTWLRYGPLSRECRRAYSGLDAEQNWPNPSDLRIHFAWHEAIQRSGSYDSSPAYYSKETSYPDGLFTPPIRLPNSGIRDVWLPCIGIKDSFVVITAINYGASQTTYATYIWRSTDYGETWDTGRVFLPGPLAGNGGPHFRFGSDGYMFFLWNRQHEINPDLYWPYYCESFDYGYTWTQPQLIWQNNPPYPNMSNVTSWSRCYDCEVVQDKPVATIKLSSGNLDYGEIWVYRPISGGPGNWVFNGTKLVGQDSTDPGTYARYPSIAADDLGNTYIGYQAIFATPSDTGPDIGLFVRPANQDTWIDYGACTFNYNDIEEKVLEFAHNAPIIGDSVLIGMIYNNAASYPTAGYLYFDYYKIPRPGIQEIKSKLTSNFDVQAMPNPFSNQIIFSYPKSNNILLEIFDVSGRLVHKQNSNQSSTLIIWNGNDLQGKSIPMGVYFYKLNSNKNSATGKVIRNK